MDDSSEQSAEQIEQDRRLLWLDMEMTGLDPAVCVPIEIAAIVTTADLEELDCMETVIHQPDTALAGMNDFVRSMHTSNGLLTKVSQCSTSLAEADDMLRNFASLWCQPGRAILAGNSIHQDRLFINGYFPKSAAYLHYRMVDVSSVKELLGRWFGTDAVFAKRPSDHTALSDVRASIQELKFYRERFFHQAASKP